MTHPPTPPSEPDDFSLMALVKSGSEDAFRILLERHQRPLLNYFSRMGVYNHMEDLAQETFLRLWKYRFKYKPSAKFTTFLYTLARTTWLDFVRRQCRFQLFTQRYRDSIPDSTDGGIPQLRNTLDIQSALDRLPAIHREAIVLIIHQGLTYDEAAAILHIPAGTVKSRVSNALATLKELHHEPPP